MKRFRGKYRIPSARLPGHDYGAAGWYFVTICTNDRRCFLGDVVDGEMCRSPVGQRAHDDWRAIPDHFDRARLDAFVVMPNHVHGLVGLLPRNADDDNADDDNADDDNADDDNADDDGNDGKCGDAPADRNVETRHWHVSTNTSDPMHASDGGEPPENDDAPKNQALSDITPDAGSLAVIINQYKGAVTRWARTNGPADFGWQSRFYDRVVRNRQEQLRIQQYIQENPAKWQRDRNHPDRL